jgi:predicted kinase
VTRVTLGIEAAIKIGSGTTIIAAVWTPTIRSNTMRALMTVATVAAFVFVATGQADAQKRTGGTHAATQTTLATQGLNRSGPTTNRGAAIKSKTVASSVRDRNASYQRPLGWR